MANEAVVRLGIFFGLFALFAIWEMARPRRRWRTSKRDRWITNWSVSIINTGVLRLLALLPPVLAIGAAADAADMGWGLLNQVTWPTWVEFLLAILILDAAIWFQHWATHRIPILWRLHRVHHTDADMDVTTALRFHPIEIGLSMIFKIVLAYALGPAVIAVLIFEILLNGLALFNHANIAMPRVIDQVLRWIVVTPDMHRVHHSVIREEHDSNYGFGLSIWDRIFGSYRAQPKEGHTGMEIGQRDPTPQKPSSLGWSLALPFRK